MGGRKYRLSKAERIAALTFRLPDGATEVDRFGCRACAVPVANVRIGTNITIINVDGTPHRASCADTFQRRRQSIALPVHHYQDNT